MTSARMKTNEFTISHDAKMLHDHDVLMKINMNDVVEQIADAVFKIRITHLHHALILKILTQFFDDGLLHLVV